MRRALAAAMVAAVVFAAHAADPAKGARDGGAPDAGMAQKAPSKSGSAGSGGARDGGSATVREHGKAPAPSRPADEKAKPCEEVKPCAIQ